MYTASEVICNENRKTKELYILIENNPMKIYTVNWRLFSCVNQLSVDIQGKVDLVQYLLIKVKGLHDAMLTSLTSVKCVKSYDTQISTGRFSSHYPSQAKH